MLEGGDKYDSKVRVFKGGMLWRGAGVGSDGG